MDPEWHMLERTYADANLEHIWQALFEMGKLFRQTAQEVAEKTEFNYPVEDDRKVTEFLMLIRAMPADATSFYVATQ